MAFSPSQSGRAASQARRTALSAGKSGLPAPAERIRDGLRSAALPQATPSSSAAEPVAASVQMSSPPPARVSNLSGKEMSMERRRLASGGKAALQAASPGSNLSAAPLGRRRAQQNAQAGAESAGPVKIQPPPNYVPKVTTSETHAGSRITGMHVGTHSQMTGVERGLSAPVSGTEYTGRETGAAWRQASAKVGFARTEGGLTVSGTLTRSNIAITGDERGQSSRITGEAEQSPKDDLTQRTESFAPASSFGTPRLRGTGSRTRNRATQLETTEKGQAITGSAIGRSLRVTGDESGACRSVTGTQYLAPARAQAACGHAGGGTAPAEQLGELRADPVTRGKVREAQSWGGQRVTGPNVEYHSGVTGDAPAATALLTGNQYQGPKTAAVWTDPATRVATAARMARRAATLAVTGDTPLQVSSVTGSAKGAGRELTGTPYWRPETESAVPENPVAALDERFSIRSPQRAAQLRPRATGEAAANEDRITGSFAVGGGKVTGNVEFAARSRVRAPDDAAAHTKVTGEGRSGNKITGDSWSDQSRVTGTDNAFSAARNPSERGPKGKPFAGAVKFKSEAKADEPKNLVTGMSGYSSKTGARVTLSGGAQS
jgi:hypothetical protein